MAMGIYKPGTQNTLDMSRRNGIEQLSVIFMVTDKFFAFELQKNALLPIGSRKNPISSKNPHLHFTKKRMIPQRKPTTAKESEFQNVYLNFVNLEGKTDIRKLSTGELSEALATLSLPRYRVRQIVEWLWLNHAASFSEMKNLPLDMRSVLDQKFVLRKTKISEEQISKDGTIKSAFELYDGKIVEGVLIPVSDRSTACISSQVGCSLTCAFCATGKLFRQRNLEPYELFDQVLLIAEQSRRSRNMGLSNIVLMGMGEPLLNYSNVLEGIRRICSSEEGLGMSPQRITLSTAGVAKMIAKLGDDGVRFNLALSLHAASDEKRNRIMPINETNNLENLTASLQHFYQCTGNRVTYEYILFNGFNDSAEDAEQLAVFAKKVPGKVNIIEYNPVEGTPFEKPSADRTARFVSLLENRKIIVNIRKSRGKDIDAACGQLANKNVMAKPVFKPGYES